MAPPNSEIIMSTPTNFTYTFDNFSSYIGGITFTGATILKIKAQNNPGKTCHWKLKMIIMTTSVVGSEWEPNAIYGSTNGTKPPLDLLEVRVSNYCLTPIKNFLVQNFPNVNYSEIAIIDDNALNLPGACNGSQVNTAGSYLSNYGEYSFNIDYRIKPNLVYLPGQYEISIKFCLTE